MSKAIITINDTSFSKKDVLNAIDNVLIHLNDTNDLRDATNVLNALDDLNDVSGKAKAKLLWGMERWYTAHKPADSFEDYVESVSNTKAITVHRYVNVWKQIDEEQIPKKVQEKPMRELVPIAKLIEQGFLPTKKEWDKIELASNSSELGEVIREIKGKKPRKSGMTVQVERDGSIYAYKGDERQYVGYLEINEENELVQKAIERILDGANIIRR